MTFYDEEELKNLFNYLTQNETASTYSASKESLLFGLQNYALGIPKEDLAFLVNKISAKKEDVIPFDEFKKLWKSNINKEIDKHQYAVQIMNSIREKIGQDLTENSTFGLEGLKKLLEVMDMQGYSRYAQEMIESIDFDGNGKIESVNLEFLVNEYFKYLSK